MADGAKSAAGLDGLRRVDRVIFAGMAWLAVVAAVISVIELASLTLAARAVNTGQPGLETAARMSPLNWNLRFILGEVASATGRPEAATRWYAEAIARNPACAQCAIGLAEVQARLGRDPEPSIDRAIRYGRSNAAVRVRAGTLYARLGRHEEAAREFAVGALGQRENQREFFSLLHRIYSDDFVLDEIIPDEILPSYFSFARSALRPSSLQRIWQRYERVGLRPNAREEYVAYLLRHGLAHEAWSIRFEGEPRSLGRILNGNFEERTTNAGFSWRIADGEGVRARIVECPDCTDRGSALLLKFDGETNVHYGAARVDVPTEPGTVYRLKARVKGNGITSAQGPTLTVLGLTGLEEDPTYACSFRVIGEELKGTFDWRPTSLIFSVPEACEGVQILVTRLRTRRLDKFIGGELWVDDVVLEEMVSGAPPSADDPAQQGALGSAIGALSNPLQAEIDTPPR